MIKINEPLAKVRNSIDDALVAVHQAQFLLSDALMKSGDDFFARRDRYQNLHSRLSGLARKLTYAKNSIQRL